jgi:hypothetical protein
MPSPWVHIPISTIATGSPNSHSPQWRLWQSLLARAGARRLPAFTPNPCSVPRRLSSMSCSLICNNFRALRRAPAGIPAVGHQLCKHVGFPAVQLADRSASFRHEAIAIAVPLPGRSVISCSPGLSARPSEPRVQWRFWLRVQHVRCASSTHRLKLFSDTPIPA